MTFTTARVIITTARVSGQNWPEAISPNEVVDDQTTTTPPPAMTLVVDPRSARSRQMGAKYILLGRSSLYRGLSESHYIERARLQQHGALQYHRAHALTADSPARTKGHHLKKPSNARALEEAIIPKSYRVSTTVARWNLGVAAARAGAHAAQHTQATDFSRQSTDCMKTIDHGRNDSLRPARRA